MAGSNASEMSPLETSETPHELSTFRGSNGKCTTALWRQSSTLSPSRSLSPTFTTASSLSAESHGGLTTSSANDDTVVSSQGSISGLRCPSRRFSPLQDDVRIATPPLRCAAETDDPHAISSCLRTTKRLILIRHGQSQANVHGANTNVLDPALTLTGRSQAQQLAALYEKDPPSVVFCSTLTRALQTAHDAFALLSLEESDNAVLRSSSVSLPSSFPKLIAVEVLREVVGPQCVAELRRPKSSLVTQYPIVDFSLVESDMDPMSALAIDFRQRCPGPGERRTALDERGSVSYRLAADALFGGSNEHSVAVVSHFHLLGALCKSLLAAHPITSETNDNGSIKETSVASPLEGGWDAAGVAAFRRAVQSWPNGGPLEIVFERNAPQKEVSCGRSAFAPQSWRALW